MFKGIEANIRPDGTVDMEPHELRLFEFVVASPHSLLRKTVDQTRADGRAPCRSRASASWAIRRGGKFNVRPGRDGRLGPGVRGRGEAAGRDRDRRLVGSAGRALRAGGASARTRLPLRARQRRARAPRARLHRHRDRPRAARGDSARIGSSTTGRRRSSWSGRGAPGIADVASALPSVGAR